MRCRLCVGKRLRGGGKRVDGWEMKCLLGLCTCASGDSARKPCGRERECACAGQNSLSGRAGSVEP